jgi:hypothetical protein
MIRPVLYLSMAGLFHISDRLERQNRPRYSSARETSDLQ